MSNENPEILIKLYFEANRSEVLKRYESMFVADDDLTDDGLYEDLPSEESQVIEEDVGLSEGTESADPFVEGPDGDNGIIEIWEQNLNETFEGVLSDEEWNRDLFSGMEWRWSTFNIREKFLTVHYLRSLLDNEISIIHGIEGIVHLFPVWDSSGLLHAVCPEICFPISADLSFRTLMQIFQILGISFDLDEDESEFDTYLRISDTIFEWGKSHNLKVWQTWAAVYDLGPRLLPLPRPYSEGGPPRVWIIATNKSLGGFDMIDGHGAENVGTWAINPAAKRGDIAIMYCVSPRSAIVGVYRVLEDAHRDPFGGWNGFRAEVGEKITIPWIRFSEMKKHPILGKWGLVRCNFQGLLHHEVPRVAWEAIKDIVQAKDLDTRRRLDLIGEAADTTEIVSPEFNYTEKQVEDQFIIPLLEQLGWTVGRTLIQQDVMMIKVGSGPPRKCRADFVGCKGDMTSVALMVVEAKRKISSRKDLEYASLQAESYASRKRCTRYAVISPEGVWVYELQFPGVSRLLVSSELASEDMATLRQKLLPHLGFEAIRASRFPDQQ